MSLGTSNRDGGKTSESGHLRSIYKALLGEVLSGLAVSQRGAGANMSVDIAIGDAVLPRSDGTYGHPAFNDAVLNKVVSTADPSNPRRDIVVLYLDYGVTPSTGVSNNTNGVVAAKIVAGTPAGSPVDPTDAAIQSSVGAGNPFVKLARLRVGAGVTTIGTAVIDDLRRMANGLIQGGWIYDSVFPWAYVSATSFKIAGVDVTAQFPKGTRIALWQSGAIQYYYVTSATFSTDTTVNIDGGGTYTLANVPIDRPAFSYNARPQGFPYATISEPLNWWQEIGRTTLGSNGNNITVASLPPRKYLKIMFNVLPSGAIDTALRYNGDAGNNYSWYYLLNLGNGAGGSAANASNIPIDANSTAARSFGFGLIKNVLAQEKFSIIDTTDDNAVTGPGALPTSLPRLALSLLDPN
jgi:hypothetical protein